MDTRKKLYSSIIYVYMYVKLSYGDLNPDSYRPSPHSTNTYI